MEGNPGATPTLGLIEFSAMCAFMVSIIAMAIDIMLPALGIIGADIGISNANAAQNIISILLLGLAIGQFIFGPISDATGRKPALYSGTVIFMSGCVISLIAEDFQTMLVGRFLQGFGAAGPRIVIMAVVRDLYKGRAMARIASIIMGFFILVPIIAPLLGQAIITVAHWRTMFLVLMAMGFVVTLWFGMRQPETLPRLRRRSLSTDSLFSGVATVFRTPVSVGYMLAAGSIFSAFNSYLISSPQIFADLFGITDAFAVYFAVLAIPVGVAAVVNSALVMRFGMRNLCRAALSVQVSVSAVFFGIALTHSGSLPLQAFLVWAICAFFLMGILFGNFNAIAMEPLGEVAGIGAAIIGSIMTLLSMGFGALVGSLFNQTLYPLIGAFTVFGIISLFIMYFTDLKEARLSAV